MLKTYISELIKKCFKTVFTYFLHKYTKRQYKNEVREYLVRVYKN